MTLNVFFHSYFRDLAGCAETTETVPEGTTLGQVVERLHARFPNLKQMDRSTLLAVGVEYQGRDYLLQDGDEISLFPPVQGG